MLLHGSSEFELNNLDTIENTTIPKHKEISYLGLNLR